MYVNEMLKAGEKVHLLRHYKMSMVLDRELGYQRLSRSQRRAWVAIAEFVDRYEREIDHHEYLARTCKEHLEDILRQHGVKAIVTYRAKSPDRLYEKLINRLDQRIESRSPLYENVDDVREDIADLAGVRAALYFPGDRDRIDEFIGRSMNIAERRHFPMKDSNANHVRPGSPVFAGYIASHYRVLWHGAPRKARASDERMRPPGYVEIQVASVLMHAWAEVEHDLVYKPASGALSSEEYALLDQVNGLVLSGETALRLLQDEIAKRLADDNTRHFGDESELFTYLQRKTFGAVGLLHSDKIGVLAIALRIVASNKPARIDELAKSIASPWPVHPVGQLLTQTMLENPESIDGIMRMVMTDIWHIDDVGVRGELAGAVAKWARAVRRAIGGNSVEKLRAWRQTTGKRGAWFAKAEEQLDRFLRVPNPPTSAMMRSLHAGIARR